MNKMLTKALCAFAIVATTCVSFAQEPAAPACGKMPHPPKMERKAPPHFDEETFKLVKAYREDASEANLEALKAKLAANYDERLAKKQAKLDEMKANRDQHLAEMLKHMTDPERKPCFKGDKKRGPKGPRPEMKGPKGPRPEGPRHGKKGPKGPRPEGKKACNCPPAPAPEAAPAE